MYSRVRWLFALMKTRKPRTCIHTTAHNNVTLFRCFESAKIFPAAEPSEPQDAAMLLLLALLQLSSCAQTATHVHAPTCVVWYEPAAFPVICCQDAEVSRLSAAEAAAERLRVQLAAADAAVGDKDATLSLLLADKAYLSKEVQVGHTGSAMFHLPAQCMHGHSVARLQSSKLAAPAGA